MARASFIPSEDVGLVELGVGRARLAIPVVNLIGGASGCWRISSDDHPVRTEQVHGTRFRGPRARAAGIATPKILFRLVRVAPKGAWSSVSRPRRRAAGSVRFNVMKLEEPALGSTRRIICRRTRTGRHRASKPTRLTAAGVRRDQDDNRARGTRARATRASLARSNRPAAASAHDRRSRPDRRSESSAWKRSWARRTCHACRATR